MIRNLEDGHTRCMGEACHQRMRCLRYVERESALHGMPWADRVCEHGREHEKFISIDMQECFNFEVTGAAPEHKETKP